jgi:hypothetical protein
VMLMPRADGCNRAVGVAQITGHQPRSSSKRTCRSWMLLSISSAATVGTDSRGTATRNRGEDLYASVYDSELDLRFRLQSSRHPNCLRDDETTTLIDGCFHGRRPPVEARELFWTRRRNR